MDMGFILYILFLLVPAHSGCPGQNPKSRKTVVCVYVCVIHYMSIFSQAELTDATHQASVFRLVLDSQKCCDTVPHLSVSLPCPF